MYGRTSGSETLIRTSGLSNVNEVKQLTRYAQNVAIYKDFLCI